MPKFIVEREIPGLGKLSADQLQGISRKSFGVLREMGSATQSIESFVTSDKLYCTYIAPNEAAIREHTERGGFLANRIRQITRMIDPTTAESGGKSQSAQGLAP